LRPKIIIVGAGPAGSSLAYYLSRQGFEVEVYESHQKPGNRPCAWGVPKQIERFIDIPKELVLNYIDVIDLYLNKKLLYSAEFKGEWGYVIDKPNWLKYLLDNSKATVKFRHPYDTKKLNSQNEDEEHILVLANGRTGADEGSLKLNAIEYVLEVDSWPNNKIEFWFDSSFVGYTWVFPRGDKHVSVGVGAFKSFSFLNKYLDEFIKNHPKIRSGRTIKKKGDFLVISGLRIDKAVRAKNVFAVGEAIGAVFPITGEGIRPSVMTSFALSRALSHETSYINELRKTGLPFAMNIHKVVLWMAMSSTPEERAQLLSSVPLEKSVLLATGEFDIEELKNSYPFLAEILDNLEKNDVILDEYVNQHKELAEM